MSRAAGVMPNLGDRVPVVFRQVPYGPSGSGGGGWLPLRVRGNVAFYDERQHCIVRTGSCSHRASYHGPTLWRQSTQLCAPGWSLESW